jgi:hypothetical protein
MPSFFFRITEGFAFQTDLYKPALPSANTSFKDLTALDPMIKGMTVIGIFLVNPEPVVFLPKDQTGGLTCDFDLGLSLFDEPFREKSEPFLLKRHRLALPNIFRSTARKARFPIS